MWCKGMACVILHTILRNRAGQKVTYDRGYLGGDIATEKCQIRRGACQQRFRSSQIAKRTPKTVIPGNISNSLPNRHD